MVKRKELIQLINAYLDGYIEADDLQRLESELKTSKSAQKLYWQYARMHGSMETAWSSRDHVTEDEAADAIDEVASVSIRRHSFARTMRKSRKSRVSAWTGWAMAAALLLSMGVGAWYVAVTYAMDVARIVASADAQWEIAPPFEDDGKTLRRGDLKLTSGVVHVRMNSGAEVILEGPVVLRLDGDNRAHLSYGKIAAHVPTEAHGFTINTPSIRVVDLGTDFGIDASDPMNPEVHVFEGEVKAGLIRNNSGSVPKDSLNTGQATRFDESLGTSIPVVVSTARFTRDLERQRIALHNTGEGLAAGGIDRHWRVAEIYPKASAAVPAFSAFTPANYQHNSTRSSWISLTKRASMFAEGTIAAFETSFDLSGLDSKTAQIEARVLADDIVKAYELNGVRHSLPRPFDFETSHRGFRTIAITGRMLPGRNTLRFIVQNKKSQFAFRAELNGTAKPAKTP